MSFIIEDMPSPSSPPVKKSLKLSRSLVVVLVYAPSKDIALVISVEVFPVSAASAKIPTASHIDPTILASSSVMLAPLMPVAKVVITGATLAIQFLNSVKLSTSIPANAANTGPAAATPIIPLHPPAPD